MKVEREGNLAVIRLKSEETYDKLLTNLYENGGWTANFIDEEGLFCVKTAAPYSVVKEFVDLKPFKPTTKAVPLVAPKDIPAPDTRDKGTWSYPSESSCPSEDCTSMTEDIPPEDSIPTSPKPIERGRYRDAQGIYHEGPSNGKKPVSQTSIPFPIEEAFPSIVSTISEMLSPEGGLRMHDPDLRVKALQQYLDKVTIGTGISYSFDKLGFIMTATLMKAGPDGKLRRASSCLGDVMHYSDKKVGFVYYNQSRDTATVAQLSKEHPGKKIYSEARYKLFLTIP